MRMLIVEDDAQVLQVLVRILTGEGFDPHVCTDGAAALAALETDDSRPW